VIFVSVGTHQQPFHRLLGALDPLARLDELVVQHGAAPPPAAADVAVAFLRPAEVVAGMRRAGAVICHAGVGSILVAHAAGHVPIVVPRRRAYGEHVDDHQVEFARELERRGDVVVVLDVEDLAGAVARATARRTPRATAGAELADAVRLALDASSAPRRAFRFTGAHRGDPAVGDQHVRLTLAVGRDDAASV
jgi:UDP-N-acetylglucosamine transferase subunit ALG13